MVRVVSGLNYALWNDGCGCVLQREWRCDGLFSQKFPGYGWCFEEVGSVVVKCVAGELNRVSELGCRDFVQVRIIVSTGFVRGVA